MKTLDECDLIHSKYKIVFNDNLFEVKELTTKNVSYGLVVYEKISVWFFSTC